MNKLYAALGTVVVAMGLLAGCDRSPDVAAAPPEPLEVSAEATGHYCGMLVATHDGPKGQIHLSSRSDPVWFTSVRDTVAFTRLPEEPRDIKAIYVNDMARARQWDQPEPGTWVDAREAWFVIESGRLGGMGAPEAVPFSDKAAAEAFLQAEGGKLVRLDEIPDDYVLGPVEVPAHASRVNAAHGKDTQADEVHPVSASGHPAHAGHSGHSGESSQSEHSSQPEHSSDSGHHRETNHSKH